MWRCKNCDIDLNPTLNRFDLALCIAKVNFKWKSLNVLITHSTTKCKSNEAMKFIGKSIEVGYIVTYGQLVP